MTAALANTAIVLVASGLSLRFGRKDKMLANLGGLPLIEHSARAIVGLQPLAKVAVCPSNRPEISERLIDRFVIAVNKKPKQGLGHSIAVGVRVALQFKPEAIMVCMGDMPFIEPWLLDTITAQLCEGQADIVHAGDTSQPHPPTIFGKACFTQLAALDGDDGAKPLLRSNELRIAAFNAPKPLLFDVDTREDLALAEEQLAIRTRLYAKPAKPARINPPAAASHTMTEIAPEPQSRPSRTAIR